MEQSRTNPPYALAIAGAERILPPVARDGRHSR
jgi:hypothetical protein